MIVHICNSHLLQRWRKEDQGSRPTQAKVIKILPQKVAEVAHTCGPSYMRYGSRRIMVGGQPQ
jgi:hypothetical protein